VKSLLTRTLTGALFVLVVAGSLWSSSLLYGLVFLLITVFTLREFYQLMALAGNKPQMLMGMLLGAVLFAVSYAHASHHATLHLYFVLLVLFPAVFITELFSRRSEPFHHIANTILGVIYIALPFSLMNYLVFVPCREGYDPAPVLAFFFLLWSFDTGAYLAGITMGRHLLWPSVSPKKTWEGIVGGLLLATLAAVLIGQYFLPSAVWIWLISATITGVAGTFGDLTESTLKRSLGLKDSGTILPGHGGLLDRFDSTLMAFPVYFAWYMLSNGF